MTPRLPGARLHLALYIRSLESARGAEQVFVLLAEGLAERGHRVEVLLEDDEGWLVDALRAHQPPIAVRDLRRALPDPRTARRAQLAALRRALARPSRWSDAGHAWLLSLLRVLRSDDPPVAALRDYVRAERPDLVVSHLNYPNLVLALVAPLCRDTGTRFVVSVHNHLTTAAARGGSSWGRSVPGLMRRFLREVDAVTATSEGVADDLARLAGPACNRIEIVHNPGFAPDVEQLAQEPTGHAWLDGGEQPVVLAAGKLKPQKDFATLIRAFRVVRGKRPARLVILGDGGQRESLLGLAESLGVRADVDLVGFVRNPYAWYARASVFALSSEWEGFGKVLVEALACGCPVVSTDCPSGPAEILAGGRYGRLVPVRDPEALGLAILETLDAPPPRAELAARARAFSIERAVDAYERLAERLLGAGRAPAACGGA